ncbi:MAG TPA: type II secretion system minor pseudopilin GspK [Steroidobacteraceae bacterium]|jgi:general secretion pathway protein K
MRPRAPLAKQRGVAMLIAVLIVALGTILAAGIAFSSAMSARRGRATLAMDESVLVAQAAEALAAYALREDLKAGRQVDHPAEEWGQPLGPVEVVPGITLEAYLEDLGGRFNLNSLVVTDPATGQVGVDQNALADLKDLFERLGLETKWASYIADWIDPDSLPLPDGAEDSAYAGQNPPYRTPNMYISSVSELLALPEFGRDRYLRILPYVTALPPNATINVCSASGLLLDTLVGPNYQQFSILDPKQFAKNRESQCFPSKQAYSASFGSDMNRWTQNVEGRVEQTSQYFRLTSIVTIGTADFALYSLLQREQSGQVKVLMRSFTPD